MIDELAVLKSVVKKLNLHKIPYMLTGSIAMSYYSIPRMTRDIDIVVEIADVDKFYNIFKDGYYINKEMIKSSIYHKSMFNIIHLTELVKVDFIIRKDSEYRKEEFSRKKRFKLNSDFIYIVSIEDLIISKLLWAKDNRSEVQLNDVKNLLKESTDINYIKFWSAKLGIDKLLSGVLNE
ncbi:MAG: nucleotidyltransferase family protein [Actinobacteria bacterium]|nr:nucleotidyltransferase family protein [Actinomycetota bacterium]MBM3712770.1 nucleotidyltransferase family protein [Actinomycetota bacterium]